MDKKYHCSLEEVTRFLANTKFSDYQSIELPYGLKIAGMDRSGTSDIVFRAGVKGKSVLDVGCKYGHMCHEAYLRGASRIKGVEINEEHVQVATKIVQLWNRDIEISCMDLMALDDRDNFDFVLFLNVMHHILSPVDVMRKLAEIATNVVVVEFPTLLDSQTNLSFLQRIALRLSFHDLPLAFIGPVKYHRVWYFSKTAFRNLFQKQMALFNSIDFEISPRKNGRLIASCYK